MEASDRGEQPLPRPLAAAARFELLQLEPQTLDARELPAGRTPRDDGVQLRGRQHEVLGARSGCRSRREASREQDSEARFSHVALVR
ncbi:MAG: hypothetical protein NZ704_07225 [Geminicoccaceae bacterium]|nr:hypothetical protein [Geminicoccaceae bacterium]